MSGETRCEQSYNGRNRCARKKYDNSQYCRGHKCTFHNCKNVGTLGSGSSVTNFCKEHRCEYCGGLKTINNNCGYHACMVDSCEEIKLRGNYCDNHSCQFNAQSYTLCPNKRLDDEVTCGQHKCSVEGCRNDYERREHYRKGHVRYCKEHRSLRTVEK